MVRNFKHLGLKRLYERGDRSRINPNYVGKIELILADLDASETLGHMRRPGYRLHELKGDMKGLYAVDVSGNWRIIFRFEDGEASGIDLIDYH
ncbi:MAG: type II toxin-antitoxin system RelE/ParE family toxin [Desulfurellaceae bacterium]|nr:type II toxin-antitoxin system RelE/ParE family toxin [Desulfurellaceae bacterium]